MPLWRYALLTVPLALVPSFVLSESVHWFLVFLRVDIAAISPPENVATPGAVLRGVVLAPIVETLILAYMLTVLSSSSLRRIWVVVIAAIVWGCLHGIFGRLWFFGTVWSFFVFSCAYLVWREMSFWKALLAAALPHALINSTAMLIMAVAAMPDHVAGSPYTPVATRPNMWVRASLIADCGGASLHQMEKSQLAN